MTPPPFPVVNSVSLRLSSELEFRKNLFKALTSLSVWDDCAEYGSESSTTSEASSQRYTRRASGSRGERGGQGGREGRSQEDKGQGGTPSCRPNGPPWERGRRSAQRV